MFRRSDSFTSICSCSTEISLEDEDINLESYQQVDSYQELGDYSIPINPELDSVQQPTHRIINFSLSQPNYTSALEYWKNRNPIQKRPENIQLPKEFVPFCPDLRKIQQRAEGISPAANSSLSAIRIMTNHCSSQKEKNFTRVKADSFRDFRSIRCSFQPI